MLGLQTQHDIQSIARIQASALSHVSQGRSYKFAKKLSEAGFAVVGHTNSMERHSLKERRQAPLAEKKINLNSKLAQEQFVQKQDSDTRADAQRLAELEQQLAEIQRRRELKRNRDRERRRRRREFVAACVIQRSLKYYVKTRLAEAAKQIRQFIVLVKNKNALTVASWAARIIAAWAQKITKRWHDERMRRLAMEIAMRQRLEREQKHAAMELSARMSAARGTMMQVLRTAMITVAKREIGLRREQSRAERQKGKWRGGNKKVGAVNKVAAKSRSPSPGAGTTDGPSASASGPGPHAMAFLTEASNHDRESEDGEEDGDCEDKMGGEPPTQDTTSQLISQSRRNFVDANNVPGSVDAFSFADDTNLGDLGFGAELLDDYDEEAELEKERKTKIAEAHAEREAAMQREREMRLRALAKKKLLEAEESFRQREAERMEREARENSRLDWLAEQEEAANARAQAITKKRKQAERDAKRAARELALMSAQDSRTQQREDERAAAEKSVIPRRKPKKVREPSEFELEMAELRRVEEEEAARKAAEELALRSKEAIAKRLSDFKEVEEKARVAAAEAAKIKAEKVAKVEEDRKAALKKALQAKALAAAHAKQLEKEQAAMDLSDKLGAASSGGRTHNAFGKPLGVKGFVRDKVDSRGKLHRRSTSTSIRVGPADGKVLEISSSVRVSDPSVEKWNYNLQSNAQSSDETSPASVKFPFGDFLESAHSHNLLDVDDALLNSGEFSEADMQAQGGDKEYWPFGEESNDEEETLAAFSGHGAEGRGGSSSSSSSSSSAANPLVPESTLQPKGVEDKENTGMDGSGGKKKKKAKRGLQKNNPNVTVNGNGSALGQGPMPVIPDKKMSIAEITGGSHIRDNLRIPGGLKDTPYFKSYVAVKTQKGERATVAVAVAAAAAATASVVSSSKSGPDLHVGMGKEASALMDSFVFNPAGSVSLADLPSPLDLAPPSKHPLLAAQTRALRSKVPPQSQLPGAAHGSKKVEELHALIAKARTKIDSMDNARPYPLYEKEKEKEKEQEKGKVRTPRQQQQQQQQREAPHLRTPVGIPFRRPPAELDIHVDSPSDSPLTLPGAPPSDRDRDDDHVLQGSLEEYHFAIDMGGELDDGREDPSSVVYAAKAMGARDHFPLPDGFDDDARRAEAEAEAEAELPSPLSARSADNDPEASFDSNDMRSSDGEGEGEGEGDVLDRRQEAALNAECDALRLRLEAKMALPVSARRAPTPTPTESHEAQDRPLPTSTSASSSKAFPLRAPAGVPVPAPRAPPVPKDKNKEQTTGRAAAAVPLTAKHFLSASAGTSFKGAYKIGINVPDFTLDLMKKWASEDEERSPQRPEQGIEE